MSFTEWSNAKKKKEEEEKASKSTSKTTSGSTGSGNSGLSFTEWSNLKTTGSTITGYNDKDADAGWQAFVERQKAKRQQEEEKSWFEKMIGYLGPSSPDSTLPMSTMTIVQENYSKDTSYREPTDKWTERQKKDFGFLYAKNPNEAWRYAEKVNTSIAKEETEKQKTAIAESATDGFWKGAAHTAGAILSAPLGLADYLDNMAEYNARGRITEKAGVTPFEYSQTVTGSIANDLNGVDMFGVAHNVLPENIPIIGGKGWGDVYGLGTSIAQSALAGYAGGQAGTLVQFFGSAAAAGVDDAKQRGASDDQALKIGTLSGAAEGLAEMVGVDNLLKIGSASTMRQLMKNLVKQGAAEGLEEGITTLMNNFADQIVMQDKSNFYILVQSYMAQGMSEEEAKKKAWQNMANDMAFDMVAGFASGAIHAGPQTTYQTVMENVYQPYQTGKYIMESEGSVDALKQLANDVAGVSSADMQKRLTEKTGKVDEKQSALRVGKLYETVQSANNLANASANQADIAKSLERKGFTSETANTIAEALVAKYNGQELTKAQEKILKSAKGNSAVQDAISNIMNNTKSTMGQRSDNIRTFNRDVNIGRIARANGMSADQVRKIAEGNVATQEENLPDSHYEVSADGKTIDADGNLVNIKGISSIQKGKLILETENGTVDASAVAYSSNGEAMVYEAVSNLEGIIDTDTANRLSKHLLKLGEASSDVYVKGIVQAYTYGYYGYGREAMTGENTLSSTLSEKQRNVAYGLGEQYRNAKTAADQAKARNATVAKKNATVGKDNATAPDGTVYKKVRFESNIKKWDEKQQSEVAFIDFIASNFSGNTVHVFESYKTKDGSFVYEDSNGKVHAAPNGMYIESTGDIYLDLNAGTHGEGLILNTFAHELYHHIQKQSPEKARKLAEFLVQELGYESVEAAVDRQIKKAESAGHGVAYFMEESGLSRSAAERMVYDRAFNDFVADSLETMFTEGDAVSKLQKLKNQDRTLFDMIQDFINKWVKKLREFYSNHSTISIEGDMVAHLEKFEQIQQMFLEALVDAGENFQSLMTVEENTDAVPVEEVTQYSYRSLAEAAGFEAVENEDGTRSFLRNGVKVSKVTVDDIEHSPIGAFINYSLAKNDISEKEASRQKKMFAEICTMACKTNDFSMTMQFVGSAVFTGMKANADKQYGTTYDFPSICTKTQAVIDAMSKRMVSLGRGLSSDELVKLYQDVFTSGNPVPCPECYVFSRWIGIGGLLDNIKKYQDYYGDMKVEDVAKAYRTMRDEVAAFAEEQGISFGKAKGALTSKLTKEYNKLTEKIEKAENQGEKVKPADRKRLEELEPMMNTVKGMTWLENVYFADSSLKKVNPRFRVPNEVLFDLNNGEAFATEYKEAWAFRTTQGAGYGKAITPYAEARLGEGVLVTNNTTNTIKGKAQGSLDNFFLRQNGTMDKKAREALDRARVKQKIQAFIGGQRFQSTSDARYENASDYLLAALEIQAMHGMVQVYTKVDGAVPAFSAWGFSINQSLMPLGGGLDERGNVKDTSVGGMNRDIAFRNREKHETAGTITIGVNDNHIRAMFKQWVRDFIIPYHASGGKADVVAAFRSIQEGQEKRGQMVRSTDYSRTQGDKILSDEVLRWQGKTEAEIQRIHDIRANRIAILTGGKIDMDVVRSNRFLSALYDKIYNGEWKGVKLAKSKVESQIFPNEFWDQSVSYEDSGKVTRDYLEYCNDLGFLHRFSGMVPSNGKLVSVKGYDQNGNRVDLTDLAYKYDENGQKTDQIEEYFWKVLTDRRMYDNQGKYLPQKVVTLNDTTEDTVTSFAKGNYGRQYDKTLSMKTAEEIAEKQYSDRDSDGNQLSAAQQEFFKDSKARDKNGNLLRLYHGSNYKITKFNPMFSDDKTSLFMSDKYDVAASYSRSYRELNPYEYIDENSTEEELVKAASKFVFGMYDLQAVSKADITAVTDRVIPKLPSVIGQLNSIAEKLNSSNVKNTFGARGHGRNMYVAMETLGENPTSEDYKKLLRKMIGNSPWLGMVADNLESFLAYDSFSFVHGDIESIVEEIRAIRADAALLNAMDSDEQSIFRYEDNMGRTEYINETQLRKQINYATSGGILPVYANIINPFILDAKGRRWNNIKTPEEMLAYHGSDIANTRSVAAYAKANGYDGVIIKGLVDMGGYSERKSQRSTIVIAFDGTQMKSTMNQNPTSDPDIRYSDRDYAYNTLVSKPDMVVTEVGGNVPKNRADVAQAAKQNAATVGKFDPKTGSVSVHVDDIGTDVILSTKGLRHGLRRTQDPLNVPNYIVTVKAGEILKNAIRINEITPSDANAKSSYVLLGAAKDANGTYVVRFVVNHFDNSVTAMDVLYAINAKKEPAALNAPRLTAKPLSVTGSTITIAELLDHVNQHFPDILPEEVLKHYGYDARPEGDLGEDALYSDRIDTSGMNEDAKEVIQNLKLNRMGSKYGYGVHKYASYTADRMERILYGSMAKGVPDYAHGYIAWVDPEDFLRATTTSQEGYERIKTEAGDLDHNALMDETQPIYLRIDSKTKEILGHEGRHRLSALAKAGYDRVAVVILSSNRTAYADLLQPERYMSLKGQNFGGYSKGMDISITNALPLSERYADAVKKLFSEVDGSLKFSDRDSESVSNRSLLANAFEGVAQDDFERNKIREYKGKIDLINAEERKLAELNQKIKDLSFSKGPKDTKAIKDLQFEAKQAANRINTYDSQLLRLEASKPLQAVLAREKQKAYKRAEKKGKEALEAYRERAAKTQRELLDRYQESRKKATESREKTAMRHKIQSVVGELNDLLLNESKKRHVPDSLKKAVADALALVNMDTVGAEERAAKYAALIARETDPDKIDAYTMTMENILRQGEKMGQRLKELRDAYEEIQDSDDPDIANAYDPVIAGSLKELSQSIGNTSLRNMTIEQLSDVYDMYRMVLTRVREANKTLMENIKENISGLASRVIGEVRISGGEHKYRAAAMDPVRKFLWNNLKPVYAMEHIGSGTLTKVFDNVRSGEDTWAKDVTEAREFYLDKAGKFGYDSWDFKKKYSFESNDGTVFELTLEQILSLYAYSKREQAADHLRLGGFVFDSNIETYKEKDGKTGKSILKYRVNTADAHQITPEILMNITGKLSDNQKAFVDEMQGYLSTVMGAKGNEVTMKMYGVKLFKEKFYFPLKSAKQFMFEQNEVSGEVKIKNSGFTNKVVAKANNPVILSNFMDVWSGHVNDMSMYHAFVLPLEDFNRVFNYNSPKKEGQPPVSVKGTIQNAYSPAAVNYVKGLITDLNGGARGDSTTGIINKMMGLFKKGSVFASLSVVVQQPSAIARAAALVDTKYFIGAKVDSKRHKALWEEIKQYAPVAIIKEMGYFDTNMGKSTQDFIVGKEYSGIKEKMKALVTDSDYRDEVLSKAPALADELAWCSIWEAVKRETKAQYPGLDAKSEPFLMLAGSRFTEVITKTQVYDSVLARSANMRSKDTGMKMATAFMAEPTTSINMIADALLQGKRGKKRYARAAIGAVIASQIFNAILVSFVYAGRDDDEDKTYWEKYIGTLSGEIIDSLNPAGYIPFIKDIQSIVQGYDVERSDMAVISDLWKAWENLSKDNVSVYRKVEGFAGSIAQIFGLPVKNIMRDVRGIWQTVESFMNGQQTTKAGIGYAVKSALPKWMGGGDTTDQNQLYEAMLSGDKAQIARVKGRYKDQSAINSAIRKGLRENDPRIKQAAQAKFNGNLSEYTKLAKAIIGEKHFSQDDVVAAINAEINLLDTDKATASTQKASGLYKAADFATAIVQGNSAMANAIKTDIIQTAMKNGKTESEAQKSFSSTASGDMKELYLEGKLSESAAMDALVTYCGADQEDADERVASWVFEKQWGFTYSDRVDAYLEGKVTESELRTLMAEYGGMTELEVDNNMTAYNWMKRNPEYDLSVSEVLAYTKTIDDIGISVEGSGIDPNTFVEYRDLRSQCKGVDADGDGSADRNTVKNEVLLVIDALPISNYQKDVLYYLNGWAASKLWQAPWH